MYQPPANMSTGAPGGGGGPPVGRMNFTSGASIQQQPMFQQQQSNQYQPQTIPQQPKQVPQPQQPEPYHPQQYTPVPPLSQQEQPQQQQFQTADVEMGPIPPKTQVAWYETPKKKNAQGAAANDLEIHMNWSSCGCFQAMNAKMERKLKKDRKWAVKHEPHERYNPENFKYNDVIFVVLYLINVAAYLFFVVVALGSSSASFQSLFSVSPTHLLTDLFSSDNVPTIVAIVFICAAIGLVVAIIWLILLKYLAHFIAPGMLTLAVFGFIGGGSALIYLGTTFGTLYYYGIPLYIFGGILIILGIVVCVLMFHWTKYFKFLGEVIKMGSHIIQSYPSTILLALFIGLFGVGYMSLWAFVYSVVTRSGDFAFSYGARTFLVFNMYWTLFALLYLVRCTVDGTAGAWYFLCEDDRPSHPVWEALKRSLTYSLGSILFGALIVSFLKTLKNVLSAGKGVDFIDAILNCLSFLLELINSYGYVHVSVYGQSYVKASLSTFKLMEERGSVLTLTEIIIYVIMKTGGLVGGALCAVVAYFYFTSTVGLVVDVNSIDATVYNVSNLASCIAMAFGIGYLLVSVITETAESAIETIVVCFQEDSDVLEYRESRFHKQLMWASVR